MKNNIKYYYDIEQGTDEWLKARLGIVTASNINVLLTPTGKPAKNEKVRSYAQELFAQRILMKLDDNFQTFDMIRGHIQEEIARDIYSDNYAEASECGFIVRDFGGFKIGASPDGLVGDDGGVEIKSRLSKFQIKTIISDEVPKEYINQIQACMLVSGRNWWDFIQYSNGMPFYVKRVFKDDQRQQSITDAVDQFEDLISEVGEEYTAKADVLIDTEYVDLSEENELITSSET